MKKKLTALSLIIMMSTTPALALYDATFWGTRALGMGGAFTAVSEDVNAPAYNIAGIGEMEKAEVTFMSAKVFSGLDGFDMSADYLAFVYPVSKEIGSLSLSWSYFGDTGLRREDSVSMGYARELDDLIGENEWVSIMAGLNFRYLSQEVLYRGSLLKKAAFAFDIGILARLKYGISIGYSGRYFNRPDIGFKVEDRVKQTNVIGGSYYTEEIPFLNIPYFTFAVDYEMREGENTLLIGAESRVIDGKLSLRMGGWKEQLNFGAGYGFDFGKEGSKSRLMIDYAFGLPLEIQDSTGNHFVSLTYRFP